MQIWVHTGVAHLPSAFEARTWAGTIADHDRVTRLPNQEQGKIEASRVAASSALDADLLRSSEVRPLHARIEA
jgi:hypothetical protein